ncbi:MAG: linear amide C-N hydrolase [Spirulina sp.]
MDSFVFYFKESMMFRKLQKGILAIAMGSTLALNSALAVEACSRFLWNTNDKGVFASRSMDWGHSFDDILIAIPRGVEMDGGAGENSLQWTSKYGSVVSTIIPYAKKYDFTIEDGATDGINEAGLAAHILYLEETQYAEANATPAVTYLRWVRYILDNFATVEEAVKAMRNVRIAPVELGGEVLGTHLAIEDSTGDSAIFEILNGEMVVHHGKEFNVMTNDPSYDWQLTHLRQYQTFGGQREVPGGIEGADRFVRLAYFGQFLPEPETYVEAIGSVFSAIRNVAVPFGAPYGGRAGESVYPTWWLSAIDFDNRIYYFNWVQSPNIIWVELDNLDLSEGSGVRQVDPKDPSLTGDVSSFFAPARL